MNENDNLTNSLQTWIDTERVPEEVQAPTSPLMMKLTPLTARIMEKHYEKQAQKKRSLRERKRYTRKRGTVHHLKKKRTARLERERRWATDPYWCLSYGYGNWQMDRELFDRYILPLWSQHSPSDLKIKRHWGFGTKEKPYTVFSFDIVHSTTGEKLYDGNSQYIYHLSSLASANCL